MFPILVTFFTGFLLSSELALHRNASVSTQHYIRHFTQISDCQCFPKIPFKCFPVERQKNNDERHTNTYEPIFPSISPVLMNFILSTLSLSLLLLKENSSLFLFLKYYVLCLYVNFVKA